MAFHQPPNLHSDDDTESIDLNEANSPVHGGNRGVVRGFATLAPRLQLQETSVARSQSQSFPSNSTAAYPEPNMAKSQTFPSESGEVYGHNGYMASNIATAASPIQTKLDSVKEWSMYTVKFTKQWLGERLGKASKTVEPEIEAQVVALRDTQRRYQLLLQSARVLSANFAATVRSERAMADLLTEMAHNSPELQAQLTANSESQRVVAKNGDSLIVSLNFFTTGLDTLCSKTIEDTLQTVGLCEKARIEFDAHRVDLEQLRSLPRDSGVVARIDAAERKFDVHREKYERIKADLIVKLKFLDVNRVKVMHKHLVLLNSALAAYFSSNYAALEAISKQLADNLQQARFASDGSSWLERSDGDK